MADTPKTIFQFDPAGPITGTEVVVGGQAGKEVQIAINDLIAAILSSADPTGTALAKITEHLAAFTHGDINHTNRAALNSVSGVNTGDQDLSGYATKSEVPVVSPTAPPGPIARLIWYNTTDNAVYQRNTANTAWIFKGFIDKPFDGVASLSITTAGSWANTYAFILLQQSGVQYQDNTIVNPSGKWIEAFDYSEVDVAGGLTSLTFDDLSGAMGNITPNRLASLTSLNFPQLVVVGGHFSPNTLNALTTLTAPKLTTIVGAFGLSTNPLLTTLSFPALVSVRSNFSPQIMAAVTTASFPALVSVFGNFVPNTMGALTALSFPSLVRCGSFFNPYGMNSLTSFLVPALKSIGGALQMQVGSSLTTVAFTSLETVGDSITVNTMTALTSLTFPALISVGGTAGGYITISAAPLVTFTLGATLKKVLNNVSITGAALNQASVDNILVRLAALDGTNGTTAYSGRTVTLTGGTSSTPSATGLTAKATLVARGCTVTHN